MRNIQIYIVGQRLELFQDEKITVNSSIQNVYDIAKVFTDFSQGFTVPATPHNNAIFQHFYQSDVDADLNLFDFRTRQPAKIEIETIPFKIGKIQLEKANIKDGQVESYTIAFYGDVITLKDKFGELKLSDLDYSSVDLPYSSVLVESLIETTSDAFNMYYPLISSGTVWTYDDGSSTDIKNNLNVEWDELFPALRLSVIMSLIETQFGITFNSIFFDDDRFKQAFLYYKNRDTYTKITNKYKYLNSLGTQVIVSNPQSTPSYALFNPPDYNSTNIGLNDFYGTELWIYNTNTYNADRGVHNVDCTITCSNQLQKVYIDVFKNGIKINTYSRTGDGYLALLTSNNTGTSLEKYEFYIYSEDATITVTASINYSFRAIIPAFPEPTVVICRYITSTDGGSVLTIQTSLKDVCPEIKLADFFSGVLKEFNLVCYGVSEDVYQIEPLDSWYQKGAIIDVTKYLVSDNIEVNKVQTYKRVTFKYKESKSFMNQQFKKQFSREYGNVTEEFINDGGEYLTEVPFENLLFQKFTDTDLQVGYTLEEAPSHKPYTPNPIILYKYGSLSCDFKFNGIAPTTITQYVAFGQDLLTNNEIHTLNFNAEVSTLTNQVEGNTLFADYYFGYLTNLYNLKNRLIRVQTVLPISILTGLRLNDRLIIRDKRYIINSMQSDLTTGEVTLELINDFRPILADGSVINVSPVAGCYILPVVLGNTYVSATLSTTTVGVTITPSTITEDTNVQICIPDKLDKQEIRDTEAVDQRITEDGDIRVTEDGYPQLIAIDILYTGANGTLTTDITMIQI